MADIDHPKTHVEDDKDVKLPRKQPESPKHEGIDPLTESDTMYPAENTKSESLKLEKKLAKEADTQPETDEGVDEGANARGAADPKSSEPAETDTPKAKTNKTKN